jgi:hypothetical protein
MSFLWPTPFHLSQHLSVVHFVREASQPTADTLSSSAINENRAHNNKKRKFCSQAATAVSSSSSDSDSDESNEGNTSDNGWHEDEQPNYLFQDVSEEGRLMSFNAHINALPEDKYDPERVLQYLSWSPRPLTQVETEVVRFLRNCPFGEGMSKAHTKELLHYVRGVGGISCLATCIHSVSLLLVYTYTVT